MTTTTAPITRGFERIEELISSSISDNVDAVLQIRKGLPYECLAALSQYSQMIPSLVITKLSTRRLRRRKGRLSSGESERLLRIARTIALAEDVFGHCDVAKQWLSDPRPYLPGFRHICPLELARTDPGGRLIEERLLKTTHGVF